MMVFLLILIYLIRMDRDIPIANPLIFERIQLKNMQHHYMELTKIKNLKTTFFKKQQKNIRRPSKKEQLQKEKQLSIQRANELLFNRMNSIRKRSDPFNQPIFSNRSARINQTNHLTLQNLKIRQQNRAFLNRMFQNTSTINNKHIAEDRKKQLKILKNMRRYSSNSLQNQTISKFIKYKRTQRSEERRIQKNVSQNRQDSQNSYKFNLRPRYMTQTDQQSDIKVEPHQNGEWMQKLKDKQLRMNTQQLKHSKTRSQQQNSQPINIRQTVTVMKRPNYIFRNQISNNFKNLTLYERTKIISQKEYLIKVIRTPNSYQIKCFADKQQAQYIFVFPQTLGTSLMEMIDNDYQTFISFIQSKGNKLCFQSHQYNQILNSKKIMFKYKNSSHITQLNQDDSHRSNKQQDEY